NAERQAGPLHGQRDPPVPSGAAKHDLYAAAPGSDQRRPLERISTSENPGQGPGVSETARKNSSRDFCLFFRVLPQHVAAAPNRFDVILAAGGVGELLT